MSAWAEAKQVAARLAESGVDDAAFEAEYLTRTAAGMTRAEYFAGKPLDPEARHRLDDAIARRLNFEPAAYISGHREFFGHDFLVTPDVLVPRPETELLVEAALSVARPGDIVADVGTGSGCVAVSVALGCAGLRTFAVDISASALRVAHENARRLGARVEFVRGNLLGAVAKAGIVTANLPYIASGEIPGLQLEVRDWEPRLALDGGDDGLDLIRELVADCALRLRPRLLALEVAAGQAPAVAQLATASGARVTTAADLAGIERMVCASWE